MHDRVPDAEGEDEAAGDLVEVHGVVEREDGGEAELAQLRDGEAQHRGQDEHGREVEALPEAPARAAGFHRAVKLAE